MCICPDVKLSSTDSLLQKKANIQAPTCSLPEHLKGLYEQSAKGTSKMECAQIHSLLLKHKNVFSKDDYDLGHTNLAEHTIDTGNAKPIKQPPMEEIRSGSSLCGLSAVK